MTKEQYEDFRLMLKGCGAGLPMYSTLNRFERVWFSSIIEILTEKDKQLEQAKEIIKEWLRWANDDVESSGFQEIVNKAEQFLREIDITNAIQKANEGLNLDKIADEVEQDLKGEDIILEDAQAGNSPFDADEVFNKEMKAYPEEKVK